MVRPSVTRPIDVLHLGRDRVICAYEIDGVIVDPGPASSVDTLINRLGPTEPRVLLLTHIHLDHAGATGVLCKRYPKLKVYVHEVGAPHLIDPSKLLKSAGRLYGDDMWELWGEVAPVPEDRRRFVWFLAGGGPAGRYGTIEKEAKPTPLPGPDGSVPRRMLGMAGRPSPLSWPGAALPLCRLMM